MNYFSIPGKSSTRMAIVIVLLFFTSEFSKLLAQNELPDNEIKERIEYIRNVLEQGKPASKLWWNGWLYGYAAATAGQGAVALATNSLSTRQDMVLGAATTLIGAAGQLAMPMLPSFAPKKLELIPEDTPEERLYKLERAEELFEACALREKDGRSWKMHAASGAVNLGSGLVTWLGFKRTIWAGLGNFALNTAITEAQIWTQPVRAIREYKEYCERYKSGLTYLPNRHKSSLFVNAYPGGIAFRFVF